MSLENTTHSHYSVLLNESIALLPQPCPLLIDCTLGTAGHALKALQSHSELSVVGIDTDDFMLEIAKKRLEGLEARTTFYHGWFNDFLSNYPAELARPNAILIDLGISMVHYKTEGRGFSLKDKASLDMRLNPSTNISAIDIVNNYSEAELTTLFFKLSEEKKSHAIAKAIVARRAIKKITTATDLADIIRGCFGGKPSPHHPATRVFQALRIAVNDELGRLEEALTSAWALLGRGSRLLVISFHSLEDRIVKQFMAHKSKACRCPSSQLKCSCSGPLGKLINKGGTTANETELAKNPASRSARLRVIEKVQEE